MNTRPPVSAVIFDLANTIVETLSAYRPRTKTQGLLGLPNEQYVRNLIYTVSADQPGMTPYEFCSALVRRVKGHPDDALIRGVYEIFDHNNSCFRLRPDALQVLQELRHRGNKLALLSNCTPFARPLVEKLSLPDYFDAIVLSSEVGYMKPDPRVFHLTLSEINADAAATCVVGDQIRTDVLGGALTGCRTILFSTASSGIVVNKRLPVDAVVGSLTDVLDLPFIRRK